MPKLSPQEEKAYLETLFDQSLVQLRVVFVVLIVLYGGFGYLDLLLIEDYLRDFQLIRFAIVIPLFIITIILTFYPVFRKIGQYVILLDLVVGGSGISYMLIRYPENMSYYGGVFMVIFAGYFLIKLNTRFATAGGLINIVLYSFGYYTYNQGFDFDIVIMLMFFIGSNAIGIVGSYQLETANKIKFRQKKEIQEKNRQLIARVSEQHETLLRVEKAVESTSDAIGIFDLQGKIFYINKAFCSLTDFSQEDLKENSDPELLYEGPGQLGDILDAIRDGSSWKGEQVVISKTGERYITLMHADAVKNEEGEMVAFILTHKDITERKEAEEALAANEEKYRLLTEFSSDVIWIYNMTRNRFTYVSPSIYHLRGYTTEEAMAESLEDALTRESLELVNEKIADSMQEFLARNDNSECYTAEVQQPCKDGKIIWVEVSVKYRYNKDGELELVGASRNIAQRKESEEKVVYLSYHDQLTGLYNRRFYEEELKRLDTSRNLPLSMIMVDVNGLKLANDAFGHHFGDKLLIKAAEIINKECRSDDIIARIGGDEFVILLPKTEGIQAGRLADRIKKQSGKCKVSSVDFSISLGAATKVSSDESMEYIFKKAEDSMYQNKLHESPSMRSNTIKTIIHTLFEKLPGEKHHSDRVSRICESAGRALDLNSNEIAELKTAGLLHDIGKIALNEAILHKPGALDEAEWTEIKRHPETGYRILSSVNEIARLAGYVLAHHENWDGSGYPKGLKEKAIPLQSRIIRIADAYDAMTSERSYKNTLSRQEALAEIEKNAGHQFDPHIAAIFIEKSTAIFDQLTTAESPDISIIPESITEVS